MTSVSFGCVAPVGRFDEVADLAVAANIGVNLLAPMALTRNVAGNRRVH